jgi:hypothetical protein
MPVTAMPRRRSLASVLHQLSTLVLVVIGLASPGLAQGRQTDPDILTDLRRPRQDFRLIDRAGTTPEERRTFQASQLPGLRAVPEPAFELNLSLPFTYNTNALVTRDDEKSDWHGTPELGFQLSRSFGQLMMSASGTGTVDRYLEQSDADGDEFRGEVRAAFTPTVWSFYGFYRPTIAFEPTFEQKSLVLHDLVFGVSRLFTVSIPATPAVSDTLQVQVRAQGTRRLTDPSTFDAWIAEAGAKTSHPWTKAWLVSLAPSVRAVFYDEDFNGESRADVRIIVQLGASWQPTWLVTLVNDNASIDLIVSFVQNISTVESNTFTQWDLGPSLNVTWKF